MIMKARLLKKIRLRGRSIIYIYSVSKTNGTVTGMGYSFTGDEYLDLFSYGDTEDEVREKAMEIYLSTNMDSIRKKYRKYSRKYKNK